MSTGAMTAGTKYAPVLTVSLKTARLRMGCVLVFHQSTQDISLDGLDFVLDKHLRERLLVLLRNRL